MEPNCSPRQFKTNKFNYLDLAMYFVNISIIISKIEITAKDGKVYQYL
jgi:hypothetical protein